MWRQDGDYNKLEQMLVQRSDIIVDVDCKDKRTGNTALIWAAKKGHNKVRGARVHTPSIAFWHLPPNSARTGGVTEVV